VARAVIKGEKTLADLAKVLDIDPTQITAWSRQVREGATDVFGADDALALLGNICSWPLVLLRRVMAESEPEALTL